VEGRDLVLSCTEVLVVGITNLVREGVAPKWPSLRVYVRVCGESALFSNELSSVPV